MSSGMRTRPPCCCCAVLALRLLLLPLAAHGANNAESLTPTMGFNVRSCQQRPCTHLRLQQKSRSGERVRETPTAFYYTCQLLS